MDEVVKPKKKMPIGRRWVKGQSGNPNGQPKKHVKALRRLTAEQYVTLLNKYLNMPVEQLMPLQSDKTLPMMDAYIIGILIKGRNGGDTSRMEALLQRMIGPVKQVVDHTVTEKKKIYVAEWGGTSEPTDGQNRGEEE